MINKKKLTILLNNKIEESLIFNIIQIRILVGIYHNLYINQVKIYKFLIMILRKKTITILDKMINKLNNNIYHIVIGF